MTIAQETPMDAARRLAAGALRNGFKFEALHAYTDREGSPLYCGASVPSIRRPGRSGFGR